MLLSRGVLPAAAAVVGTAVAASVMEAVVATAVAARWSRRRRDPCRRALSGSHRERLPRRTASRSHLGRRPLTLPLGQPLPLESSSTLPFVKERGAVVGRLSNSAEIGGRETDSLRRHRGPC